MIYNLFFNTFFRRLFPTLKFLFFFRFTGKVCLLTGLSAWLSLAEAAGREPGQKAITAMVDSAGGLVNTRPEAALQLYRRAFDLAIKERLAVEAMDAFSHVITFYNNTGRYDEALAETRRVMMPWKPGPKRPISPNTGVPIRNVQPVGARP